MTRSDDKGTGLDIRPDGALDFLSLGALVHRLDPGIVPFRKATHCDIHVSGGEFNVAANLADCFGLRTGIVSAMVNYPIGHLIAERVRAMGVRPFYKHFEHEGGISAPLVVRWPAAISPERRGSLVATPAHVIDIMPTCLEIAGAAYPRERNGKSLTPLAGESLAPIFRGVAFERKRPIFWEHEGNRAVRRGQWKLVAMGAESPWELYDIDADRTEKQNLAAQKPEIVNEMAAEWEAWAKSVGATPLPDREPWTAPPGKIGDGT